MIEGQVVFKIPARPVTYLFISRRAATAKRKGVTWVAIMLCFQRLFQNKHGLDLCCSLSLSIPLHGDHKAARGAGGRGCSCAGSQFGHGLKDALGHGHVTTRGCCRVESSEPRTTKMLPFGLRKMLRSEIICCWELDCVQKSSGWEQHKASCGRQDPAYNPTHHYDFSSRV